MKKALILAQSRLASEAVKCVLRTIPLRIELGDERLIAPSRYTKAHIIFEDCAKWIASYVNGDDPVTVIVDSAKPSKLNPVDAAAWEAALAMLILAFPEARWIIAHTNAVHVEEASWQSVAQYHSLASAHALSPNAIFDGGGLREWVRSKARLAAPYLPERKQVAAAVDEETAYADFHAYVAYRCGFRAFTITTDLPTSGLSEHAQLALTFEDIYLNFPDKRKGHYSSLRERAELLPVIDRAGERYFITVGHRFGADQGLFSVENQKILRRLREQGRGGKVLNKPVAGMHAMWKETGLERKLEWFDAENEGRRRTGVGDGYTWPPRLPREGELLEPSGHSAPGRLVQVAEHLIHRAEKLIGEVRSVQDAVRGAVLATDALELLGCRTPTLARDALELKHRFEVMAECQFGGVEFNLNLESRFAEVRRDMEAICVWFGADHRQSSLLNGELTIISRLLTVFREYNEYDEEDACLQKIRSLQTALWTRRQGVRILFLWPMWLLRRYIEWIIVSPQRLFGAICVSLVLVFASLRWGMPSEITGTLSESGAEKSFWSMAVSSVNALFGAQPSPHLEKTDDINVIVAAATCVGAIIGFLHLGIFISRLYSSISRK